jgi:NAD-dependent dihydropyrimidine dehydrogenase PreA subunit
VEKTKKTRVVIYFIAFLAFVAVLSLLSVSLWGEKPEKKLAPKALTYQGDMTVAEFGKTNQISNIVLKNVFGLVSKEDLQKKLKDFPLSQAEVSSKVNKAGALEAEHESKNWVKIPVKFALWFLFLGIVFVRMKNNRITVRHRRWFLLTAVTVFGIIMGSDPSPMGTVKDAIVLFGKSGAVFLPRMIALTIFLVMVFVANKFICSWGCQFGTSQDFIFRLNRDGKDSKGIMRQLKPPFVVTNAVRIAFFVTLTLVALLWAADLIEPIDPFKTFVPAKLGIFGILTVGVLSVSSLFIYRPWCHFFCPFGLVGWIVEKKSWFKINVNYETCVACEACAKACPSTVMNAILKQEHVTPDCFSCSTCIETCPTQSIHFVSGKRNKPPQGKFKKES